MANIYVWSVVSFVNLGAIITGLYIGGYNAILEMDGFKDTFSHLYVESNSYSNLSQVGNQTRGCGFEGGTDADSEILIGLSVSSSNFGAFVGSLIAGWLSDQFSRKYALSMGGVVMLIGSTILSAAFYVWMLIVGRSLSGIGKGIIYMVMPIYIAEMTPKESRGMLGSIIGPAFAAGMAIILIASVGFAKFSVGWRVSFANNAFWGLVFAIGMATYMPHTPRWLVKKKRDHEALLILSKINHSSSKDSHVDTFMELEELRQATHPNTDSRNQCGLLLKELFLRKYRLMLGCILFILAATVGTFIYNYTTTFFCQVGIPGFYASLVLGLIFFVASIVVPFFVDRFGRKTLFLVFTPVCLVSGLISAILIQLYDSPSEIVGYSIVSLICIYTFGFGSSWLALPWIINSEIFPIRIRGVTVAIASGIYWFSASVMSQLIPLIVGSPLQLHGYFYIVSAINLFGFILILFALPETKGVSLEKMNDLFSQSIWQRFVETFKCSFSPASPSPVSHMKENAPEDLNKALEALDFEYDQKTQEDSKAQTGLPPTLKLWKAWVQDHAKN